ncbi:MAG TPA: hypothetical protein VF331_18020 [Polyangiales bacterium]
MTKASEWLQRVAAWQASGLRAGEFCVGRDYSAKTLQWWSSRLRHGRVAPTARGEAVRLARVVRSAVAVPPMATSIVIEVGGARVEVRPGVDRAALQVVLEVLSAARIGGAR